MRLKTLTLRLAVVTAALAVAFATAPTAVGDPPAKQKGDADGHNDHPNKARWEWKILDNQGKSTQTGTFMGYRDGTVKHGKEQKQIGSFKTEQGQLKVKFTSGPLAGEATMVLAERKPIKYSGELTKGDGSKVKLVVEIIND